MLGTYVGISISGCSRKTALDIINKSYLEIEKINKLMSFHDPQSELSNLNHTPVNQWRPISPQLTEVLTLSLELQRKSEGQFNVATAGPLIFWGFLPGTRKKVTWNYLSEEGFELDNDRARRILPVQIDLGGIAKGYAVDCATAMLKNNLPNLSGCVNAGGDLRVFGKKLHPVYVRLGTKIQPLLKYSLLKNEALATSSTLLLSPYVQIQQKKLLHSKKTVTVRAEKCIIADALTKVVLLLPTHKAQRLAAEYQAEVSLHL